MPWPLRRPSARAAAVLALLLSTPALAVQYESEVDIDNEEDLYELQQKGAISDETLETLLELIRQGVDLNTANRDDLYTLPNLTLAQVDALIKYRETAGWIEEPADLVKAKILTKRELGQVAPFVTVTKRPGLNVPVSGRLRVLGAGSPTDGLAPPYYSQLRVKAPLGFSFGLVTVGARTRVSGLQWDESLSAMTAAPPGYQVVVPKFFAQWKSGKVTVVAGTFQVGFGQRLTLDNTTRWTPNGLYVDDTMVSQLRYLSGACRLSGGDEGDPACTDEQKEAYVTPDFRWRDRFRGVAANVQGVELGGDVKLSATGFASLQSRPLYQYALFNPQTCADPYDDSSDGCSAPSVYYRQPDGTVLSTKYSYQSLQNLFNELAAGGNAQLQFAPGVKVGVTGYFANPLFNVPNLDFQEWARYPFGGPFGTVGVDGALNLGMVNLFLEGARSFNSIPAERGGGGGFGVIQRSVLSIPKQEVELSLRYYDAGFINPYSRAISEPDQLDGQRVRNEAGVRARYLGKPNPDLQLRADVDLWTAPRPPAPDVPSNGNLRASVRGDFTGWSFLQPGLWVDYRNKGLAAQRETGAAPCYEASTDTTDSGDAIPCDGQYFRVTQRLQSRIAGKYAVLVLQAWEKWVDDPSVEGMRMDVSAFAQVISQPLDNLRLSVRSRYLDEAIGDDLRGERSLWSFADVTVLWNKALETRVRYDNYAWLDQREGTLTRTPNPEHRFRVELEARF